MKITYKEAIIIQSALSEMLESMELDTDAFEDGEAIADVEKLLTDVTLFLISFEK